MLLLSASGRAGYSELRKERGWPILSGSAAKAIRDEGEPYEFEFVSKMRVDDYLLIELHQDREAAHRWHIASTIKKNPGSVQSKVLAYLHENVRRLENL